MATVSTPVDSTQVWNPFEAGSKPTLLRVVREEAEAMFALASDPAVWERGTAAGHWQVRDIIGHMVDVTEGYLERFEATRSGGSVPAVGTLAQMARILDEHARAFRSRSQQQMLERLRGDFTRMAEVFEGLTDEEWNSFVVAHGYMGPLPAMFYPTFQLIDYSIHTWDIREGLGMPQMLSADAADLLVPIIPILWQATLDPARLGGETLEIGVRVSGRNAGTLRLTVTPGGLAYAPGPVDDLPATLEFDAASLVLTAYGRMRAGAAYGDRRAAARFGGLFFAI